MIRAKSTVKIDWPRINELSRTAVVTLEQTAEALHTDVVQAQVIPFDTGNLQDESFWVDYANSNKGIVTLNHSTPYARRLYFHPEYNFSTDENPNAKGNWYEDWKEGGSKEDWCAKTFAELYRRNAGI